MYRATAAALLFASLAPATTYNVGDGQPYPAIGSVPWESLASGDLVLIHARPTPYREKWVICRQGTATAPIIVRGVPDAAGNLPIIDGASATTRLALDFWSETRGVIKVGGSSIPADVMPRYITIENLEIRGARPPATFTDDAGNLASYPNNAAAIYVEKGENITVRNCIMHDCGNGFFVASSDDSVSRDILIESNSIYSNGNVGSLFEHNTYTAAIGITYQYNRFGPPLSGAQGNNLKDRSAGLVVRYNWIEGGNRQLDLVDAEDSTIIQADPRYRETFVYGNVLVEPAGDGNRQITHYGGDSGNEPTYRQGTLYFYHNTIVSTRTDRTTLFRLSTNAEHCDARNNIFWPTVHSGSNLSLLDATGVLDLSHNWFKPGYVATFGTLEGTINNDGTSILGSAPGLASLSDLHPIAGSACIDAATALLPAVLPANDVTREFVPPRSSQPRPIRGIARDVGAFEQRCPGDVDADSDVDLNDLATLLAHFGTAGGASIGDGDTDGDGDVDLSDLAVLLARFGQPC